jgi:SH3-like domain-containing protein
MALDAVCGWAKKTNLPGRRTATLAPYRRRV